VGVINDTGADATEGVDDDVDDNDKAAKVTLNGCCFGLSAQICRRSKGRRVVGVLEGCKCAVTEGRATVANRFDQ
jgi:hypothetical protein